MKKMMRKMRERNGFTLAELLIVVAIIGVLVAVAIPVFTAQLEKSRCAVDIANLRSSYAEAMASALADQTNGVGASYKARHTDESAFASAVASADLTKSLADKATNITKTKTIMVTVDSNGAVSAVTSD